MLIFFYARDFVSFRICSAGNDHINGNELDKPAEELIPKKRKGKKGKR
jgi:hypothetical protein